MSQTTFPNAVVASPAVGAVRPDVQAAIARAAQATGVDFSYLLAQARIESSLNPSARAQTSSAAGLYQFTQGTWLTMLDRHGARHGLGWADAAIDGGRVTDPALRSEVMALRFDPNASALMAAELANDNRASLTATLGREPDAAELYVAHFLGAEGAARFLTALSADPAQSAAALLPAAAAANRGIFFADGAPRSVGQVMDLLRGKVAAAMDGTPVPAATNFAATSPAPTMGPLAREFHAAATSGQSARPSMAETLAATFGAGSGAAMPSHVRAAYGKLRAFGL